MLFRSRVPLAKFEAASAHKATDLSDPGRFSERDHGAGWAVNETKHVYRQDLADAFLNLFNAFDHTAASLAVHKSLSSAPP